MENAHWFLQQILNIYIFLQFVAETSLITAQSSTLLSQSSQLPSNIMPHVKLISINSEDVKHVLGNTDSMKHIHSQPMDAKHNKKDGKILFALYIENDFLVIFTNHTLYRLQRNLQMLSFFKTLPRLPKMQIHSMCCSLPN